jgi:hypothetical protein
MRMRTMDSDGSQAADGVPPLLVQFLELYHWSESRRLVEQHPELLDNAVIAGLERWIDDTEREHGEDAGHMARQHLAVLRRIREVGIAEAFRPLVPDFKGLDPPEVMPMPDQALRAEERYDQTGDPIQLDVAVAAWEYILADPVLREAPVAVLSAVSNDSGVAYLKRYQARRVPADLDAALRLLEQAVRATPAKSKARAKTKQNLKAARRLKKRRS